MTMIDKIQRTHLERKAIVYLRQSTLKQVHEHPESTSRQYALQQRAVVLGWAVERIDVIDDDLGQSGSSADDRIGFQRLAADVARGRVGIIFALEVSRLARCSADWHRLLDLCGLADVLIGDEQAIYSPLDYNDRLLLGIKGTMSEAEQYWMRLRLEGGKLNKVRRGEFALRPPAGYQWDESAHRLRLDPDEQVQRFVRLVFERFRIDGSASAVVRYLRRQGIVAPLRDLLTKEIRMIPPRRDLILIILHNPIYAGAYVYGRREQRRKLVDGRPRQHTRRLAMEEWKACIHDQHPAYVEWDEFMENQRKLKENLSRFKHSPDQRGAARQGRALLQGLLLCGRCGDRMSPTYQGERGYVSYVCQSRSKGTGSCWSVSAHAIDKAVVGLFLEAVQPVEIELGLSIAREAERQSNEIDDQWRLRLERACYEARLAERRYKAVDPDNRVVARTLEREWNEKQKALEELELKYDDVRRKNKVDLSEDDRRRVLALATDLPRVWNSPTTTHVERKNLLRMLIREITISPIDIPSRMTRVQVLWQTGAVTDLTVPRPDRFAASAARAIPAAALDIMWDMTKKGRKCSQIADVLNAKGILTGRGKPWSARSVMWTRADHGIRRPEELPSSKRLPDRRKDGLYSIHGVAARFRVTEDIVRYWIVQGWLQAEEGGGLGRASWFRLDRATTMRLRDAKARGYGPLGRKDSEAHSGTKGHHE